MPLSRPLVIHHPVHHQPLVDMYQQQHQLQLHQHQSMPNHNKDNQVCLLKWLLQQAV